MDMLGWLGEKGYSENTKKIFEGNYISASQPYIHMSHPLGYPTIIIALTMTYFCCLDNEIDGYSFLLLTKKELE